MSDTVQLYPLLFMFREVVFGQGFIAGINLSGRAVAEENIDGGWWVYGVNPGSAAGCGANLNNAFSDFRQTMEGVFFDLAEEASDFAEFKASVGEFFHATHAPALADWEAARRAVREGKVDREDLEKVKDAGEPTIEVVKLRAQPSANVVSDQKSSLAA